MTAQVPDQQPSRIGHFWREWRGFVAFVAIMLVFRSAIADWNGVPTGSMIPSILVGDRIVVDKLAYDLRVPFTLTRIARWSDPARSDVITFESPVDGKLLVKRVIGVPGDRIELRNNALIINGEPAQYRPAVTTAIAEPLNSILPYVDFRTETVLGEHRNIMLQRQRHQGIVVDFGPVTVPANHYLVMGDNRDNSQDYRAIGFINRELVTGKANSIAFSLDYDNYYVPRSSRFFRDLD